MSTESANPPSDHAEFWRKECAKEIARRIAAEIETQRLRDEIAMLKNK